MEELEEIKKPEPAVCGWYDMVKQFHGAFGHPIADSIRPMYDDRRKVRARWLLEEVLEFHKEPDVVDQVNELIDLIYFTLGIFVEMGVDPTELFDAVHWANMNKLWPDGKPRYDTYGKILKPTYYESPRYDIEEILNRRMKEHEKKLQQELGDDVPF